MEFFQPSAAPGRAQEQSASPDRADSPEEAGARRRLLRETNFDSTLDYLSADPPCEIPEELLAALDELTEDWLQGRIVSFERSAGG